MTLFKEHRPVSIRRAVLSGALTVAAALPIGLGGTSPAATVTSGPVTPSGCPFATEAPAARAAAVAAKMTTAQLATYVALQSTHGYENYVPGFSPLCVPSLSLSDGPAGISFDMRGVSQMPSPLVLGASFDASLARAYGEVLGVEALAKGIRVVQGPNLNLARIPEDGRNFEAYGEDPYLTARMGAAEIAGIQSVGALADAKHYGVYAEETDRLNLSYTISPQTLQQVYLEPFRVAVKVAHVGSIMCSYSEIAGTPNCEDKALIAELHDWGFHGFVRSDLGAGTALTDLAAGNDLVKPATAAGIETAVAAGTLSRHVLVHAVAKVLATLYAHPEPPSTAAAHSSANPIPGAAVSLRADEEGAVLLRDAHRVLPLTRGTSVALIGPGATSAPVTNGGGSAAVVAPFVVSPLAGLHNALGSTPLRTAAAVTSAPLVDLLGPNTPLVGVSGAPAGPPPSAAGNVVAFKAPDGANAADPSAPVTAPTPSGAGFTTRPLTYDAASAGTREFVLASPGDVFVTLDGRTVFADRGVHVAQYFSFAADLAAGTHRLTVTWYGSGEPSLGVRNVQPAINAAARVAASVRTPVVFVNDWNREGIDKPSLALPGFQDQLVAAVAAANRRTVVVVSSGNPVLMPWARRVSGILENWYAGEMDGTALAALLTGAVDPSGRLPLTFPVSDAATPVSGDGGAQFPGIDGHVVVGSEIGYQWYVSTGTKPLFPFGFGLSYTRFVESHLRVTKGATGALTAQVTVRNVGGRAGRDSVLVFASSPDATHTALRLVGFSSVALAPGASATVRVPVTSSALATWTGQRMTVVPGRYVLRTGASAGALRLSAAVTLS